MWIISANGKRGLKILLFHIHTDQKVNSAEEFSTQVDRMTLPWQIFSNFMNRGWIVFKITMWAGEMAQWLGALPALPELLSSIPGNHMVAHNHL